MKAANGRSGSGMAAASARSDADGPAGEAAIRAIRETVMALEAGGVDRRTIAISLHAAATHEMINAYGKDEAGKLAAQMYMRGYRF